MENNLMVREYLGRGIEFKIENGEVYANANSMCDSVKLDNWKRSPNTKRYMEALKNKNYLKSTEFIKSEEGRSGGTWIHEKLVLFLARYISVEFEIWCDEQIATLIREGEVSMKQLDSYMIDDPIERAEKWILEYKEKEQLKLEVATKTEIIEEQKPLVELAEERLSKDECVSITDVTRTYELKRGQLTKWAKQNGYIHKTITEVNLSGLEYFKIYDNGGFKNIGITKKGLKFIEINLDDIKQL